MDHSRIIAHASPYHKLSILFEKLCRKFINHFNEIILNIVVPWPKVLFVIISKNGHFDRDTDIYAIFEIEEDYATTFLGFSKLSNIRASRDYSLRNNINKTVRLPTDKTIYFI